jgi:hypothetical protein
MSTKKVKRDLAPTSSSAMVNRIKEGDKKSGNKVRDPRRAEIKADRAKKKALLEEKEAMNVIKNFKKKSKKNTDENDHLAVYMQMYRQLRRIIKKTEKGCLKSTNGAGAYQLATYYRELRETIADIRSLTDMSDQAQLIIEKILQPLFTSLVQDASNSMQQVKLRLKDQLQPKRVRRSFEDVNTITIEQCSLLNEHYNKACAQIKQVLLGE